MHLLIRQRGNIQCLPVVGDKHLQVPAHFMVRILQNILSQKLQISLYKGFPSEGADIDRNIHRPKRLLRDIRLIVTAPILRSVLQCLQPDEVHPFLLIGTEWQRHGGNLLTVEGGDAELPFGDRLVDLLLAAELDLKPPFQQQRHSHLTDHRVFLPFFNAEPVEICIKPCYAVFPEGKRLLAVRDMYLFVQPEIHILLHTQPRLGHQQVLKLHLSSLSYLSIPPWPLPALRQLPYPCRSSGSAPAGRQR